MNKDILSTKWQQLKGDINTKWGDLTDDELESTEGRYEKLVGKLQERYAHRKVEVKKEFDEWLESLDD